MKALALLAACLLAGCDPLYGVRMSVSVEKPASLQASCVDLGLRSAGFTTDHFGHNQLGVRGVGASEVDPNGYWFMADVSQPNEVVFYSRRTEPFPCQSILKFVPRMRDAVLQVQEACAKSGQRIVVTENWYQNQCGL